MTKDSDLYKPPTPPQKLSQQESDEYIQGYRSGWTDEGGRNRWMLCGDGSIRGIHLYQALSVDKATDAFKRGFADGGERAHEDLKAFEVQIRKDAEAQNQPSDRTR